MVLYLIDFARKLRATGGVSYGEDRGTAQKKEYLTS